jgi:hypothetical protein
MFNTNGNQRASKETAQYVKKLSSGTKRPVRANTGSDDWS